jgi:uncharacterized membrane protein YdbT with pleckstrin-like domain
MSSYVDSILDPNETVVYRATVSIWAFTGKFLLIAVLLVTGFAFPPLWLLALVIAVNVAIAYLTTELAITSKRVVAKFGFIRRQSIELLVSRIETVRVEQGLLGRMMNFGCIVVAGAGNPSAPIPNISDPMAFRRAAMGLQTEPAEAGAGLATA